MTRASALTTPEPDEEAALARVEEMAEKMRVPGEDLAPAQEMVPAGIPRTPLHIDVKNLITREEARETEVRLLDEKVRRLEEELKDLAEAWRVRFDGLAADHSALLARVQELGDWIDAPDWKPGGPS